MPPSFYKAEKKFENDFDELLRFLAQPAIFYMSKLKEIYIASKFFKLSWLKDLISSKPFL